MDGLRLCLVAIESINITTIIIIISIIIIIIIINCITRKNIFNVDYVDYKLLY